jgi:tRNA pseudouridine55 synthase
LETKDGVLLIDKEPGMTSHDVVQRIRRLVGQKKAGHCGTLDPNATGLLLLTLGKATRLTRFLIRAPKVYEGVIRFGVATDTYDSTGEVTAEASTEGLTHEDVVRAMATFEGTIEHAAPPYSAKKVGGKKLYELARQGEEVPRESKEVIVYEFGLADPAARLDDDRIAFRLACASGTYARTLAHDLGAKLGCGAHLEALRRVKIGPFELSDAVTLGELAEALESGAGPGVAWVPFDRVPLPFGEVVADHRQEERVRHGQTVLVRELEGEEGDWIRLVNRREELIAVGTVVERIGDRGVGIIQPRVVFA